MDEKSLAKMVREVVKEELNAFKQEVATKEDLKAFATKEDLKAFATREDLKAFATKEDLKAFATREDLKAFATREDLKAFATKEDLKAFATKEDLKAFATKEDQKKLRAELMSEIKALRNEMVTRDDLRIYITKEDFNTFLETISQRLESFSERTLSLFKHYENDVRDLHRKFEMIDFGLLLTHLDRLAGAMEKKEQERILSENQFKRQSLEMKERLARLENLMSI